MRHNINDVTHVCAGVSGGGDADAFVAAVVHHVLLHGAAAGAGQPVLHGRGLHHRHGRRVPPLPAQVPPPLHW